MRNSIILIIFFCFCMGKLHAQSPSRLMRTHEKGDFAKTRELIVKSLEKDSINPAAKYLYSILFMLDPFRLDTDSARWFINAAIADYKSAGPDVVEDLQKTGITLDSLQKQKLIVTSDAFAKAKAQSTVYALDYFLQYYPQAPQQKRAIFIRDSLAYDQAKDVNTWLSYKTYLETYPDSYYYEEADKHYQRLIFLERTLDNKLSSYIRFLKEFPQTPHRDEIEWVILSRTTVDHRWESYLSFLKNYPHTHYRKQITDVMYYIDKINGYPRYNELLSLINSQDSVNQVKTAEYHLLIPFYVDEKYGFMSSKGETILENKYESIHELYYCGGITDEWLLVGKDRAANVITRSGEVLLEKVSGFDDIGNGLMLVDYGKGSYLYHKSGFRISERLYQDAEVVGNKFIKVKKDEKWGLLSVLGESILDEKYESIESIGKFILVGEDGEYHATNVEQIAEGIKDLSIGFKTSFDDFEVLGDTLLLTFNGDKEALYDSNLNLIIPEKDHRIFTSGASWYVKGAEGYQIYNRNSDELINQTFEYLDVNNGWLSIKRENDWLLISQGYKVLPKQGLDSIRLINDYAAFIKKGDTLQLIFNSGRIEWLQPDQKLILLTSRERTDPNKPEYIMLFNKKYRKILSSEGSILFDGDYDQVDFLTDSLFTYNSSGKFGILDAKGNKVVSAKYESINTKDDLILLLEKGKIGSYNPKTGGLIAPEYDSRITSFGHYFSIAKEGKYGLINGKNKVVIPFKFDEFMSWNDTSFFARDSTVWSLLTFDNEVIETGLMNPTVVAERGREKFLKVMKDQTFGILSSKEGEILEPVYNDIVNVGIYKEPTFFAEQHLKAAAFFVVTYFDRLGQSMRSQAYRPDEYTKIYCDQ
ncbi:MAG: WG repeat-containing protein [Cyclobacteriaceae bacterium]